MSGPRAANPALEKPHTAVESLRVLSISHRTAALGELERFALPREVCATLREQLRREAITSVVLCTCNRTELYWASSGPRDDRRARSILLARVAPARAAGEGVLAAAAGLDAFRHMLRVSAGLESALVGESEILGQVREALEDAERDESAGDSLPALFRAALRSGGRARTETRIGAGALSVASVAVQLVTEVHPDLSRATVVVIGAGAVGLKVARHLRDQGVGTLVLSNRTEVRARAAAADLGAVAAPFERLSDWLARADAVVAAVRVTAPLVTAERLHAVLPPRRPRALVLVDLSLPRAIEPSCSAIGGVALRDLSGLERAVACNRAGREGEVARVEALIERDLEQFQAEARGRAARPLIAELRRRAEDIRREEIARALDDEESGPAALERITRRLVGRLLLGPSRALRRGELVLDPRGAALVKALFGLDGEGGDARR